MLVKLTLMWHEVKRCEIVQNKLCDPPSETCLVASKIIIVKSDCYTESTGLHQISKVMTISRHHFDGKMYFDRKPFKGNKEIKTI